MRAAKAARTWAEKQTQQYHLLPGILTAPLARLATITALIGALAWPPTVEANVAVHTTPRKAVVIPVRISRAAKDLAFVQSLGFDNVNEYVVYRESGIRVPDKLPDEHLSYMLKMADKHDIPKKIMFRLIQVESEFNKNATSRCGAKGYMQLMPGTKRELMRNYGIKRGDMSEVQLNLFLGTAYLKDMYKYSRKHVGSDKKAWRVALACYNTGPDNVHGFRVPSYCRAYVNKITQIKPEHAE